MFSTALEASIFANYIKKIWTGYYFFEQRLSVAYRNSCSCQISRGFRSKIRFYSKNSVFGRHIVSRQTNGHVILGNSYVLKSIFYFYNAFNLQLINYSKKSLGFECLKGLKMELCLFPLRTLSIFMIIVICVNLILSLVLQRHVGVWGYLVRGLLLLVGIPGIYCKAKWPVVRKNSIFLKNDSA